ncbi:MAG: CoA transferase [Alphaproteobacteria bacterium]|nr:CoA transferase [Alphaproteobacteria bacterium]
MDGYAALDDLLAPSGRGPAPPDEVMITGADPVLGTNFLLGTAGAAVLAAIGLAASDLWELRTGRRQNVSIDTRSAAMALRCDRYQRLDDGGAKEQWGGISGFHQGGDGRWVQLHCNFPHHRAGVLKILGCEDDRAAVSKALAERTIPEFEQECYEAGMCVAMVRSAEEWAAHPHSVAVDGLPLYEIVKIGDSDPEPLSEAARPLSGTRVLDLTRVIAGPMCGRTLAEHSADVLRISGEHLPFFQDLVMDTGHGKRSAFVDLRKRAGGERLRELVRGADVFSQGYRPGGIQDRGFGPAELAELRPGIVYVTLSAYGHEGPWRDKRGFDSLVQCCTGIVDEQSAGEDVPRHMPAQALDYVTGYLGAFGAMHALARRAQEGGSWMVRVSLCQTAHWIKRLGRVDGPDARGLHNPGPDDVPELLMATDSPFGRISHLAPVLGLSETPPHWDRPPVPLGTHDAVWG